MYEIERTTETQCPRCGGVALLNSSFCSYCGSTLMENASPQFYVNDPAAPLPALPPESAALSFPIPAAPPYGYQPALVRAGAFERWLAWAIDVVIIILISLLAVIPILGGILVAITGTAYLLMRDHQGASIGKRAMGLRVVGQDGRPAARSALLLRNAPLALPYLLHFIPYLGIFLTIVVWAPICFIEGVTAALTGRRISDRLAGTIVVKG